MDDELLSLAEVYALDAIDADERRDIEWRLEIADDASRAEFMARVAAAREVAADLSIANAVDPPGSLRSRVLALPGFDQHPEASRRHAGTVTPLRRRHPVATVIAGVAAAVIIAAGGIGIGYGIGQSNQPPPSDLQAEVLDAPDATLKTAKLPGGGTTTMVTSIDENAAVVLLHEAGAPPTGKVYQMWLMDSHGQHPRSVAIMDSGDIKPTTTTLVKGVKDAGAFAITVEPDGGSKKPTTKPFSLISLPKS